MTITDAFDSYLAWANTRRKLTIQLRMLAQPEPRWWETNARLKTRVERAKKGRRA